ncbi:hypothetical protein LHJ74_24310 [Streptomyces sp. N2-109]|uniref:NB-ARC domain-containing protein n=1 Tax=Streptomyces gossypii TaxID=2883101 RepID=A0ABT2JZB3_9ACTN|nr:NB-ARC domain-containing protein [Streptomyces gossypii]MCT2592998.1 hypothetical protein [Streptomyces gossypii]
MASVFGGITGISALALPLILSLRTGSGAAADPPPPSAQAVPEWVVDRDEAEQVVAAVCRRGGRRSGSAAVGITTGLQGAGGFGKTMLARVACAHPKVRRHFKGRVYVVTIGRDVRGRAAIAARVAETIRFVTGDTLEVGHDPEQAGDHLGRLLAQRPRTLLVIDDVWEPEQLEPFLRGAQDRCVRLVTTRTPAVLPPATTRVTVDRMSSKQARAVLTHDLQPAPPNDVVNALLKQTGQWALLLRMVNQVIATQAATGADTAEAAWTVVDRLRALGPAGQDPDAPLDLDDQQRRNTAVRASIQAATSLLPPGGERRFTELGIFAEDEAVPLPLVAMLWQATDGLNESRARALCKQMADLSLLTLTTDVPGGALALHDVVRDYLRAELATDLTTVNAALVDAVAAPLPPDDDTGTAWWHTHIGYLQDHLIEHLIDAGRATQAEAVAGHFHWVRARLHQRGSTAPWRDLDRIDTPASRSLARNLARAAHLLSPTTPPHALDVVLLSRVTEAPHWHRTATLPSDVPALIDRWPPPDLPDPALIRTLTSHTGPVRAAAVSPDGTWLATTSTDQTVRIWDPTTGTEVRTLTGHTHAVRAVAVSPDGSWLATHGDGTVRIWDPTTGTEVRTLTSHTRAVRAVAVSPDGTWLATTDGGQTVRIWDPTTGTEVRTLSGHTGHVYSVAVSPDGTWLATTDGGQTVRIWDPTTGTEVRTLSGHTGHVYSVAVSPDGTWLATTSTDQTVRIWDPTTGTEVRTLTGHTGHVFSVKFSPDGTWLATGDIDGRVRIWDPTTGTEVRTLHTGLVPAMVSVSPDGTWLATSDGDGTVRIWDPTTGTEVRTLTSHTGPVSVRFSPDRTWLATTDGDGTMRIWDPTTGTGVRTLTGHTHAVRAVAVSPDGTWLATGDTDGRVRIWDPTTGTGVRTLTGHTHAVHAVEFSPDGTWLATGDDDGRVRIWDPTTGTEVRTLHTGLVPAMVSVSPDGTWLATTSTDLTVRIWDPTTGTEVRTLTSHTHAVHAVEFSPDGTWLATGDDDGTVRIWDPTTGTEVRTLTGHTHAVHAVAVSPDGTWLATTSTDQTVRIWDPTTGTAVAMMRTDSRLTTCSWNPDGQALFVGGPAGLFGYDLR